LSYKTKKKKKKKKARAQKWAVEPLKNELLGPLGYIVLLLLDLGFSWL
jgi:hypothetical protein